MRDDHTKIRNDGKRVFSLAKDGISCIPVLGRNVFDRVHQAIELHVHKGCIEVILCNRGEIVYESCGREYAFRPGTVFISRPDEPHRMQSYPKGLSTCYLLFRLPRANAPFLNLPPREARWLRNALLCAPERLFDATDRIRTCFRQLFALHDSLPRGTPERTLRLRQTVTDLLVEVALAARTPPRPETHVRLMRLVAEIRQRPEADYPINELAARVALAPSVLTARFKRITGLPPHAFVIACRIEQAKRELASGGRTVADIAFRLGFPSPQHFATLFKKATGLAPLIWRSRAGASRGARRALRSPMREASLGSTTHARAADT